VRLFSRIASGLPPRLRRYVLATSVAGAPVVAWAVASAIGSRPTGHTLLGVAMFFAFATLAEWRPVPIDAAGKQLVSLAFVFIIASQLLFGWEWAVLTGAGAIGLTMALSRVGLLRVVFNSAGYALAAAVSALPARLVGPPTGYDYLHLAVVVVAAGALFVLTNVMLVCLAIGLSNGTAPLTAFRDHLRLSGPIFAIMIFVAMQAVIFWRLSAALVVLLSAPLFALMLYQRSSFLHRIAEAEAATDSLTGLKNRREFERESAELREAAQRAGRAFTLCLIDIDHFKQVNDRHGHQAGDEMLKALAAAIEHAAPARGYRLGGDEFALLLEQSEEAVVDTIDDLERLFASGQQGIVPEAVTISSGIAVYPGHADDLHSLKKRADMALYQSKYNGRAQSTVYVDHRRKTDLAEMFGFEFPHIDIRLVTAQRLASLVDALSDASVEANGTFTPTVYTDVLDRWRSFDGNHSRSVAALTEALARKLGVDGEEVEQIRLAALLHDVGKIAVPESILSKPGPLTDTERELVERHAVIGFELLRGMGLSPVDTYVLHHHEEWDGSGYPHGLAGADIPFGSRLILVADAFDALTSNRSYRRAVSVEAAMHELHGQSGRQFDPLIVAALHDHLAHPSAVVDVAEPEPQAAWSS
jgi:diguanylate cyclase (GGDEF)-like protein/putative nucleotidyltransferase with HDIG domain